MELIVVGLLVVPPVLVGIFGWAAAKLGSRADRITDRHIAEQRAALARLGREPRPAPHASRRAA